MPKKMLKADYVELIESHFAEQGKKLTNLSKANITKLKEIIEKYDIEDDEYPVLEDNEPVEEEPKKDKDLSDYNIGEVVIYNTKYNVNGRDTDINVKCKIVKINKQSLTLQHYDCRIDESDVNRAAREQTYGYRIFIWSNDLINKKVVCKTVGNLRRKDDILYNDYVKQAKEMIDFGN